MCDTWGWEDTYGNLDRYSQQGNALEKYLSDRKELLKFCESQHLSVNETDIKSLDERMIQNVSPKIEGMLEPILIESEETISELSVLLERNQFLYGNLDKSRIEKAIQSQEYLLFLATLVDRMLEVTEGAVTITSKGSQKGDEAIVYVQSSDFSSADELQQFINLKTIKNSSGKITPLLLAQFLENSRGKGLNFPAVTEDGQLSKGALSGFEQDPRKELSGYRSSLQYYWDRWEQGRKGTSNYVSPKLADEIVQKLDSILRKPTSVGPSKVRVRSEYTIVGDGGQRKVPKFEQKPSEENSLSLNSRLAEFVAKYEIRKRGSSQVALRLPAGISRLEFLKEAQELSIALHASFSDTYRVAQAVRPYFLKDLESKLDLADTNETALSLSIDGHVRGSTNNTFAEQVAKGWNNVAKEDLAVAHVAFYLLTSKDLFEGLTVRAAGGGSLNFYSDGLGYGYAEYRKRYLKVSASCKYSPAA
jgi:hypothetical protein